MYAIIRVVREKYLKSTKFTNDTEKVQFLSKLSIYLHEILHETITEYFYVPTDTVDIKCNSESKQDYKKQIDNAKNTGGITTFQILQFAKESSNLGQVETAERWYQELCAREPTNADNWFEYATFCLSTGNVDKAQQCLTESISINSNHHKSLIMAPFVLCMTKHSLDESNVENNFINEGRIFLERAQFQNENVDLTWALTALYHEYCMVWLSYSIFDSPYVDF